MEVWQRKKLKNASFSAERKCGKYFRVQTSGCATNVVGRNTWARLPVATQEDHPAARGCGGQNIPIWRSCKRPPSGEAWVPLQITDRWECTSSHLIILPDAVHCTCAGVQCAKSRSSIRSEVGGTPKLESVLGRQKNPTSVMKLRNSQLCRRSTQWTVNHTTRHLTLAPAIHCACFLGFRCSVQNAVAVCSVEWVVH